MLALDGSARAWEPKRLQLRLFSAAGRISGIGSALVPEVLEAGHEVLGLARSDKSADALAAAGASVLRAM